MTRHLHLRAVIRLVFMVTWVGAIGSGYPDELDQAHDEFQSLLRTHVREGLVDYQGLRAHPRPLTAYLSQLASVKEDDFDRWPESEQLAFLINLYNASTLQLIVDHYPVRSIKDIGGVLKGPWNQPAVRLFGRTRTLDDLEHKIIRARFEDWRIHFALVCAAKGCPPLRGEAYVGERLDEQLNDQAQAFLSDTDKNRVEVDTRTVYLSPIFKWYGADFERTSGGVLEAIHAYWPEKRRDQVELEGFKIRYTHYDWSLNERGR